MGHHHSSGNGYRICPYQSGEMCLQLCTNTSAAHSIYYEYMNMFVESIQNIWFLEREGQNRYTRCTFSEKQWLFFSSVALLTIEVGYPHQLKDSNDDQGVGGCKCVHQLQHVHPVLWQTHPSQHHQLTNKPAVGPRLARSSRPLHQLIPTNHKKWNASILLHPRFCPPELSRF